MSDPSLHAKTQAQVSSGWDDPDWVGDPECGPQVPQPEAPPVRQARAILPEPRHLAEPARAPRQEGLRIDSRISDKAQKPPVDGRRIELTEHGRGVVRLESEQAAAPVPRMEPTPSLQVLTPRPRSRSRAANDEWGGVVGHSTRWIWWAGGGVVALVLAGLAIQPLLVDKNQERTSEPYLSVQVVDDLVPVEDPTVYFSENPAQVITEIQQTVETYARATTLEQVMPVIRHADALKERLSGLWQPWHVPSDWTVSPNDEISYASVGKLPYAILAGTLPDFSRYQICLVREGGRMLVDWEATLGLGSRTFGELKDPAVRTAEMRVVVSQAGFYTQAYPESQYRAYKLSSLSGDDILWGYVPRDSPAAATLAEIFNEQAMFSDKPEQQAMRLRLSRGSPDATPTQWLVLDVLHKGWVTP